MLGHNPEGLPSVIGATLLARLAIDKDLQGQGLGGLVLFEALRIIVAAADIAAAPVIIVDAIDERASSFYRRFGFEPLASDPLHLVLSMNAARFSVGSPQ